MYLFGGVNEGSFVENIEWINISRIIKWNSIKFKNQNLLKTYENSYINLDDDKIILLGGFDNIDNCTGKEELVLIDFKDYECSKYSKTNKWFDFLDCVFTIDNDKELCYNYDHLEKQMVVFNLKNNEINKIYI